MAYAIMSDPGKFLKGEVFRVNSLACKVAAESIRKYEPLTEDLAWGDYSEEVQATFKLGFIAICHQMNWDFLQDAMARNVLVDRPTELGTVFSRTSATDISVWLSDYPKPERIDAKSRAALLRDVGRVLLENYGGSAGQLLVRSKSLLGGSEGLLEHLNAFEAYRADPEKKKSNVLIHDLIREGIASFRDHEEVKPAIDYHIIRLYLRTGRVVPLHDALAGYLQGRPRPRPRLVSLLRRAVAYALDQTAFYAGLSVPAVNYIEWQLGRAVCLRREPGCLSPGFSPKLNPDVGAIFNPPCVYSDFCTAFRSADWRALQEPLFKSNFY